MEAEVKLSQEESFVKRLFSWKYIVLLILIQGALVYAFLQMPSGSNPFSLIILVVIFYLSRKVSTDSKKVLSSSRQFVSFSVYLLITIILGMIIYFSTTKVDENRLNISGYIDYMIMHASKSLPIKVHEYMELYDIKKIDDYSVARDVRYTSYTREEVLSDYGNSETLYKKDLQEVELKTSCSVKELQEVLSLGLVMYITYYGKNSQRITQIRLDDESCKPYYKN